MSAERSAWRVAVSALLLVATAACGGDGDDVAAPGGGVGQGVGSVTTTTTTTTAPPVPTRTLEGVTVALRAVATVEAPLDLTNRSGDTSLYVAERAGRVRRIRVTTRSSGAVSFQLERTPVLDIGGEVLTDGERGLLGLAFSRDGRKLYFAFTGTDGNQHLDEITMNGDRVEESSRRRLLDVPDFASNHNGGDVAVGPDGFLYYAMGDGGGAGDPQNTGQDPNDLLGSLLRIDPEAGTAGGAPYAVPDANPFKNGGGAPEVWAYGLRNPWRISFDRLTGDLWIGDVGQNAFEEIDLLPRAAGGGRGANLGWSATEGTEPFDGREPPDGHVPPIFTYGRDRGCSVTGGFVYRGPAIPALQGAYLFGDFCQGELRGLLVENGAVADERGVGQIVPNLVSFGEDNTGELYVLSLDGPIYRIDPPG
ncbi:MAG: PQQ-dependent sugar dehydrogenase [Acidimicrobiales bacterium]